MKKVLILACAALTACTNDIDLGPNKEQVETLSNAIGFQIAKKNMTTTKATQTFQSQGHYNFGVWGYKDTDPIHEIMGNYLVGFGGDNVGYKMDASKQTTWGGNTYNDDGTYTDGKSQWAYEMLGSSEYNHTAEDGFYRSDATPKTYLSNNTNQYLRFWDHSSASTNFYAYAPYVNKNATSTEVTFDNNTKIMTFPNGSMKAGYNDASQFEYMYAGVSVPQSKYREDVKLNFKRMSSRIRVKFWEDIPGYQIKIISLYDATSTYTGDIYATPVTGDATVSGNKTTYTTGEYAIKAEASVNFTNVTDPSLSITPDDASKSGTSLRFDAPAGAAFTYPDPATGAAITGKIGEKRSEASPSATVYYGIPATTSYEVPGFIFHVSYELTSTTGEKITVRNAKVYVPKENCQWKSNYSYTYIFKITKKSNGSTGTVIPKDPDTDTTIDKDQIALFPIVFDGCTVEDYETEIENDYTISDPKAPVYTLSLENSSVAKNGVITGTAISVSNSSGSVTTTPASSSSITVESVPSGSIVTGITVTVDSNTTNNVTVTTTNAPAGTYKLIYKNGSEVVATVTFTVID